MVSKHVYLQLIEYSDVTVLCDDELIYKQILRQSLKLVPNEFFRFETKNAIYHILAGSTQTEGCHWCGHEVNMKILDSNFSINSPLEFINVFMECPSCLSRGPSISVHITEFRNSEDMFKSLVLNRYKQINAFRGFKNPYKEDINGR